MDFEVSGTTGAMDASFALVGNPSARKRTAESPSCGHLSVQEVFNQTDPWHGFESEFFRRGPGLAVQGAGNIIDAGSRPWHEVEPIAWEERAPATSPVAEHPPPSEPAPQRDKPKYEGKDD